MALSCTVFSLALPLTTGAKPNQHACPSRVMATYSKRMSSAKRSWSASLADQERLAEDMRLLYVAITRAGHACWLGLAPVVSGNAKENKVQLSAMGRLLFGEAGVATAQFVEPLVERTQAFLTLKIGRASW